MHRDVVFHRAWISKRYRRAKQVRPRSIGSKRITQRPLFRPLQGPAEYPVDWERIGSGGRAIQPKRQSTAEVGRKLACRASPPRGKVPPNCCRIGTLASPGSSRPASGGDRPDARGTPASSGHAGPGNGWCSGRRRCALPRMSHSAAEPTPSPGPVRTIVRAWTAIRNPDRRPRR